MKRCFDIIFALLILITIFPFLFLIFSILIKIDSEGSVIFKQTRVGKKGKKFEILKFRTMYTLSEENGPQLSYENDPRITKVGKILRKYRLDEFPQFINVLRGDMSVVGPRPEREFFINQLKEKLPEYNQLQLLKPGITSMGQVYFGYAENIDEMIERAKYDLEYLKKHNLLTDLKIILLTLVVLIKGLGK